MRLIALPRTGAGVAAQPRCAARAARQASANVPRRRARPRRPARRGSPGCATPRACPLARLPADDRGDGPRLRDAHGAKRSARAAAADQPMRASAGAGTGPEAPASVAAAPTASRPRGDGRRPRRPGSALAKRSLYASPPHAAGGTGAAPPRSRRAPCGRAARSRSTSGPSPGRGRTGSTSRRRRSGSRTTPQRRARRSRRARAAASRAPAPASRSRGGRPRAPRQARPTSRPPSAPRELEQGVEVGLEPLRVVAEGGSSDRARAAACAPCGAPASGSWSRAWRGSRPSSRPRSSITGLASRPSTPAPRQPLRVAGARQALGQQDVPAQIGAGRERPGAARVSGGADRAELVGGAVTDEARDPHRALEAEIERQDRDRLLGAVAQTRGQRLPPAAVVAPPDARPLPGREDVAGQDPELGSSPPAATRKGLRPELEFARCAQAPGPAVSRPATRARRAGGAAPPAAGRRSCAR